MKSDVSLLLQSKVLSGFLNVDSSRIRNVSLDSRTVGWTEVWGKATDDPIDDGAPRTKNDCWSFEESAAHATMILTQHRVGWHEQLVLRIGRIPHIVENSPYNVCESTGPLPYLTDLPGPTSAGGGDGEGRRGKPALVGRRHPGGIRSAGDSGNAAGWTGSDIADYLRLSRTAADLDKDLTVAQRSTRAAYASVIRTLQTALAALRYGDARAWEGVYRFQSVAASLDPYGNCADGPNGGGFFNWLSWSQIRAERVAALRELTLGNGGQGERLFKAGTREVDVSRAMELANSCYGSLDHLLASSNAEGGSGSTYLLGTARPTSIDATFFGHLAEALCDVHLVTVIADRPHLISFFQNLYEQYFGAGYADAVAASSPEGADWVKENDLANAANQFNRVPIGDDEEGGASSGGGGWGRRRPSLHGQYDDAIKIMQRISVHCHDLKDALAAAKIRREHEEEEARKSGATKEKTAGSMFHRWRMGGNLQEDKKGDGTFGADGEGSTGDTGEDETTKRNRAHMERLRKDQKRNDELWMSGVLMGSAMAFLLAAAKSGNAQ